MSKSKSRFHWEGVTSMLFCDERIGGEYNRLFTHYKMIALNMYRWENLPEGIESRHIETQLFDNGQVGFYDDELLGLICLKTSTNGNLNIYADPTGYTLTGVNYTRQVHADDVVRILANDLAVPMFIHISTYAELMEEVRDIMRQNARQQRFPFLMPTTKQTEKTAKTIMDQVQRGEEAIFYDPQLNDTPNQPGIFAISTAAPYILDKLEEHLRNLEKELLTILGVNNARSKEGGMSTDEINVNNNEVDMAVELGFKQRERAAELINAKFGTNIKVVKVINEVKSMFDAEKGDGEDGKIHD